MTPQKEQFIAWLNDAYSTELSLMPVLKNHAKDAEDYPEIRDRDLQHLEETRRQAERLKEMIEGLGGKVSTAKSMLGSMIGMGNSVSTEFFQDEITKNFLSDYAAEHFEIASYKGLIETAKQIGEHQCIPVLEEILREEEAMARWIENHLPLAIHIGLEKAADNFGNRRSGSRRKKSGLSGFAQKNQVLTTLVLGGAISAATLYFMRSNNGPNPRVQKVKNPNTGLNEGLAGRHLSTAPNTAALDESGSLTANVSTSADLGRNDLDRNDLDRNDFGSDDFDSNTLSRSARGNS